jgi:hypothetical protein
VGEQASVATALEMVAKIFVYLLTCLFNNAVSSSDYMKNELERSWKEAVVA